MTFEMLMDGQLIVKVQLNLPTIMTTLQNALITDQETRSTPATEVQMRDLLSRIDQRSVLFLKAIAASDDGSVTWREMRSIFGITEREDWTAYSGSFGKGITRAYRKILQDKTARLVWWNDEDWEEVDWDDDMCAVFVDGPALDALRAASRS